MHFAQWSSILLCKLHSYSSTTVQTTQYIAQWSSILLCKLHSYSSTTVQTTQYNITYCVVCTVDHETTQYTVYCAVHCAKCTVNCAVCTVNLWVFLKNLAFFNVFNKKNQYFWIKKCVSNYEHCSHWGHMYENILRLHYCKNALYMIRWHKNHEQSRTSSLFLGARW